MKKYRTRCSEKIRALRVKRGWSQSQLAEIAEISERTIQRIEKGGPCSLETLQTLASVLEIDIEEFLQTEDKLDKNENLASILSSCHFLPKIRTGKELCDVVENAHAFIHHYEELEDEKEVELLGDFLQEIKEWGDIWEDVSIADQMRIRLNYTGRIKEIEKEGFWIFGKKRRCMFNIASKEFQCDIATLVILQSTNPTIIKTGHREFISVLFERKSPSILSEETMALLRLDLDTFKKVGFPIPNFAFQ